jgi:hypothetical protein
MPLGIIVFYSRSFSLFSPVSYLVISGINGTIYRLFLGSSTAPSEASRLLFEI